MIWAQSCLSTSINNLKKPVPATYNSVTYFNYTDRQTDIIKHS